MSGFHMNGQPCQATQRACPLLGTEEHFDGSAAEFAVFMAEKAMAGETQEFSRERFARTVTTSPLLTGLPDAERDEITTAAWDASLKWEDAEALHAGGHIIFVSDVERHGKNLLLVGWLLDGEHETRGDLDIMISASRVPTLSGLVGGDAH